MRMNYRDEIVESAELYFKAQIKKHKVNVDNLLENHIALAEHPDLMKTIEDEIGVIAEYEDILWSDLGILFRNINDGYPLNGQQKRQSFPSVIAEYVRNMRENYEKSLSKFISPKSMRNLGGDEFIAKCMSYVVNVGITSAKALNFIYENPKTAASVVKPSSGAPPHNNG